MARRAARSAEPGVEPHAPADQNRPMKLLLRLFGIVHAAMALIFAGICVMLMVIAVRICWNAVGNGLDLTASLALIEAMGITAVAVVALQIAQTITEEEVIRGVNVSAPTRVRRFLSRFIVVIVVALAIEGLVATVKTLHEDPTLLPYASSVVVAVAALIAAWGVFIRLNRAAEEIEPEAMAQAKKEDRKLE
jgi:hypothetical protein